LYFKVFGRDYCEEIIMIARYTSAVVTGSITTSALFFLMQALIAMQPGAASDPREHWTLDVVRVKPAEELKTLDFEPIDKVLKEPPPVAPRPADSRGGDTIISLPPTAPPAPSDRHGGTVFRINDGPPVAIVRVQPVYPFVAETRGLEGWVLVEFDVRPDGGVANAFIVESSSKIFEKAALSAAYRFRFKPRVVDGVPQLTAGVQNLFRFEISDD
jgi:protein TonB